MTSFSLPETYRAWTWMSGTDPLDLVLTSLETQPPQPGEVLVQNEVIGLNPVDWKVLGSPSWKQGKIPGCDAAGRVVALGEGVTEGWLGQRVAYHTYLGRQGSFAELTPVVSRALLPLPAELDFATAASILCSALTAWLAIAKLPAQPGSLLIAGAGGAVGNYLVQIAARKGWEVTAQCHPRHHARLAAYGASVLPWDATLEDNSFYAAVDLRGSNEASGLFGKLRANGHLVTIQGRVPGWGTDPFGKCVSLHEVALGALHVHGDDRDWQCLRRAGRDIFCDLVEGRLIAEDCRVKAFEELPQLLNALKHRSFGGRALIRGTSCTRS